MFGNKDDRDEGTGIIPRAISYPILGAVGYGFYSKFKTAKTLGFRFMYPSNFFDSVVRATSGAYAYAFGEDVSVSGQKRAHSTSMMSPAQLDEYFGHLNQSPLASQTSTARLERMYNRFSNYQKKFNYVIKEIEDRSFEVMRKMNTVSIVLGVNKPWVKEYYSKGAEDLSLRTAGEEQALEVARRDTRDTFKSLVEKYKDRSILNEVKEKVAAKFSEQGVTTEVLDNTKSIMNLPGDVIDKVINEIESYYIGIDQHLETLRIQFSNFDIDGSNYFENLKDITTSFEKVISPYKYIDISESAGKYKAPTLMADLNSGKIAKMLDEIPSAWDGDFISSEKFSERILGSYAGKKFNVKLRKFLSESGVPNYFKPIIKADMYNFVGIIPEHFNKQFGRLLQGLREVDRFSKYSISSLKIYHDPLPHSNVLIFDLQVIARNKEKTPGGFKFYLTIPKEGKYQANSLMHELIGSQASTGSETVVQAQVDVLLKMFPIWAEDSTMPQKQAQLQGQINRITQGKMVLGNLSSRNQMNDMAMMARFSADRLSAINMAGLDTKLDIATKQLIKLNSGYGQDIISYVDFEFDTDIKNGKKFMKSVSVINLDRVRNKDGTVEIKIVDTFSARFSGGIGRVGKYQTEVERYHPDGTSAMKDMVIIEDAAMVDMLNSQIKGKNICMKAPTMAGGDVEQFKYFIHGQDFKNNKVAQWLYTRLDDVMDIQNFMYLPVGGSAPVANTMGNRGSAYPHLIRELKRDIYNREDLVKLYGSQLSVKVEGFISHVEKSLGIDLKNPALHDPRYDIALGVIHDMLLTQFRFSHIKHGDKWQDLYPKINSNLFKSADINKFLSASSASKGIASFLEADSVLSLYGLSPQTQGGYQAMQAAEVRWGSGIDLGGRHGTMPFMKRGTEEMWFRNRNFARSASVFFDYTLGDGQMYINRTVHNNFNMAEKVIGDYVVDTKSIGVDVVPGKVFNPDHHRGIVVGSLDGKPQIYWGENALRIVGYGLPSEDGKIRVHVEELLPPTVGMKIMTDIRSRHINSGLMDTDIEYLVSFKAGAKEDTGAMFKVLLGRFIKFVRDNVRNDRSKMLRIIELFNDTFRMENGNPIIQAAISKDTGEFYVSGIAEGINLTNMDPMFLIKKLWGIYKHEDVKLMHHDLLTDQYKSSIVNAELAVESGKWIQHVQSGIKGFIMDQLAGKGGPTNYELIKNWLEDAGASTSEINKMLSGGNVSEELDKILAKHGSRAVRLFDYMAPGIDGVAALKYGYLSESGVFNLSSAPSRGTDVGKIYVNDWYLDAFKYTPGAKKYVQYMLDEMGKQSHHKLGQSNMQLYIGSGKYTPTVDQGAYDMGEWIDGLMKEGKDSYGRTSWERMFSLRHYNQNVAGTREKNFTKVAGELVNANDLPDLSGEDMAKAVAGELSYTDLNKRRWSSEYVDFMRMAKEKGTGYLRLGQTYQIQVPGGFAPINTVAYSSELIQQQNVGRNDTVQSEITQTLMNITIKVKGKMHGVQEEVQKLHDLLGSVRTGKRNFGAYVPGAMALLQFARPYVENLDKKLADINTEESAMIFEGFINKGQIKKHADDFASAMKNVDGDYLEVVGKYVGEYRKMMGTEAHWGNNLKNPKYAAMAKQYAEKFSGEGTDGFDRLISSMMRAKGNADNTALVKQYGEVVEAGILPIPVFFTRHPKHGTRSSMPGFAYFRDWNLHSGAVGTVAKVSNFVMKQLGGDQDGDLTLISMIPKFCGEVFEKALGTRSGMSYSERQTLGLDIKNIEGSMAPSFIQKYGADGKLMVFWNNTKGSLEVKPTKDAQEIIAKDINTVITDIFKRSEPEFGLKATARNTLDFYSKHINYTKETAGASTKVLYAFGHALQILGKDWDDNVKEKIFNDTGGVIEYAIKQKSNQTDPMSFIRKMENLDSYSVAMELNESGISGKLGPDMGKMFQNDPELEKLYEASNLRQWLPKEFKNKGSSFAFTVAASRMYSGLGMFGDKNYKILKSHDGTVADLQKYQQQGFDISAFSDLMTGIPDGLLQTHKESFGHAFKKSLVSVMDEALVSKLEKGSKIAGGLAAGLLVMQLFRPDASGYLGHMPGRGGEYWDWSFTRPELDWSKMINTPLNNVFDRSTASIEMENPMTYDTMRRKNAKFTMRYEAKRSKMLGPLTGGNTFEF